MTITILKSGLQLTTGPKGNVYLTENRKPHLIYELDAAELLGLVKITR